MKIPQVLFTVHRRTIRKTGLSSLFPCCGKVPLQGRWGRQESGRARGYSYSSDAASMATLTQSYSEISQKTTLLFGPMPVPWKTTCQQRGVQAQKTTVTQPTDESVSFWPVLCHCTLCQHSCSQILCQEGFKGLQRNTYQVLVLPWAPLWLNDQH